ncbi:conserved hypothetical protein [Frankia sp. Hr75.2]|nr:conserved hypothetical protein [Frankia sp. Hr75.2]
MPSIPPGSGGWRNPYEGRPFVAVEPRPDGRYEVTIAAGAMLRDLVDVTATLPRVIYTDHRPVVPGGTDVRLIFRSMHGDSSMSSGGWVPPSGSWGSGAWTSYQDALHTLLNATPQGPTGERLFSELLRLDPRSVVALADMVRVRRPVRA